MCIIFEWVQVLITMAILRYLFARLNILMKIDPWCCRQLMKWTEFWEGLKWNSERILYDENWKLKKQQNLSSNPRSISSTSSARSLLQLQKVDKSGLLTLDEGRSSECCLSCISAHYTSGNIFAEHLWLFILTWFTHRSHNSLCTSDHNVRKVWDMRKYLELFFSVILVSFSFFFVSESLPFTVWLSSHRT